MAPEPEERPTLLGGILQPEAAGNAIDKLSNEEDVGWVNAAKLTNNGTMMFSKLLKTIMIAIVSFGLVFSAGTASQASTNPPDPDANQIQSPSTPKLSQDDIATIKYAESLRAKYGDRIIGGKDSKAPVAAPNSTDGTGTYDYFCTNIYGSTTAWTNLAHKELCQGMMDVYISGRHIGHYNPYLVWLVSLHQKTISASCVAGIVYMAIGVPTSFEPAGWVMFSLGLGITVAGCYGI